MKTKQTKILSGLFVSFIFKLGIDSKKSRRKHFTYGFEQFNKILFLLFRGNTHKP